MVRPTKNSHPDVLDKIHGRLKILCSHLVDISELEAHVIKQSRAILNIEIVPHRRVSGWAGARSRLSATDRQDRSR
jgi:hypothetical protein